MINRLRAPRLVLFVAFASLVSLGAIAQTHAPAAKPAATSAPAKTAASPRMPDGHPDFTGIWTNVTITPLERPRDLAGKEFFTEQEVSAYEKQTVAQRNRDQRDRGTERDVASAYNDFWWDSGTKVVKTRRTSIIIDPPDGRIPALTAERQQQLAAFAAAAKQRCEQPGCEPLNGGQLGAADGPEDRPLQERCLSFGNAVPMLPTAYNNNYQIVESPGFLSVNVEMVHDVRRVAIDGSRHLPANVRQWMGDSRGHWEGGTLVVETTNFTGQTDFAGSGAGLRLVERFTRTDPDTIQYEFHVDDPATFTRPWTAQIPMTKAPGPLFEYACHEGNYGMSGMLSGARAAERAQ